MCRHVALMRMWEGGTCGDDSAAPVPVTVRCDRWSLGARLHVHMRIAIVPRPFCEIAELMAESLDWMLPSAHDCLVVAAVAGAAERSRLNSYSQARGLSLDLDRETP
jgi:hypothetical protein